MKKTRERLFKITDEKTGRISELVLTNGDEVVDIVYGDKWSRARGDYNLIYSQLITYGYDEAKRLAEYFEAKYNTEEIEK